MKELHAFAIVVVARALVLVAVVAGVVYLASIGHQAWPWVLAFGVLVASRDYNYIKD